jgi:hypothetical protein
MQDSEENRRRHAGDGDVGDREDARRARLIVDRRELAEKLAGADFAESGARGRTPIGIFTWTVPLTMKNTSLLGSW